MEIQFKFSVEFGGLRRVKKSATGYIRLGLSSRFRGCALPPLDCDTGSVLASCSNIALILKDMYL